MKEKIKLMKKLFNILLVLLLSMGIFTSNSVKVYAEESGTYDNVDWRITDNGELIIGKEGEVQEFRNRGIRSVGSYPWYSRRNSINSVRFIGTVKGNGNMCYMFYNSQATSLDLSSFDTSKVTNMDSMFSNSQATSLDLSSFNASKVTNMDSMFYSSQATSIIFPENFGSAATNMYRMFAYSKATSLDLSSFDTSKVTNMDSMFNNSKATSIVFPENFGSATTNMGYIFYNSQTTSLDLSNFNTSNVTNMESMFQLSQATSIVFPENFGSAATSMNSMFVFSQATSLDLSNFDTSKVTNMSSMFNNSKATSIVFPENFGSAATDMSNMFDNSQVTSLDLSSFNTANVTNMVAMFTESKATSLDLSSFNTSNVTNMGNMFHKSQATSIDLSSFNTSKVNSMGGMFSFSQVTSLDISSFNTSNVTNMYGMFNNSQVTSLDLSSFDTSNVTSMGAMFNNSQAVSLKFSDSMLGDNGERFKNTNLSGSDWVKVRDKSGNLTYNDTQFSGEQVRNLNESTTPALSGTWVKKSSPEYQSEIDKGQEYISKQGINANNEWVKNGNTWTYTFDVFDDSIPYYIWEDRIPGYTSSVMKPNKDLMNQNGERYYEIINRSTTLGNLEISKTVVSNKEIDHKFDFTITLQGNGLEGIKTYSGVIFENGIGHIKLGHNEKKLIEGLPSGTTYTVEEAPYGTFSVTSTNEIGTIQSNSTQKVSFENLYIPKSITNSGHFKLKKTVTGNSQTEDKFKFMVMLGGLEANEDYVLSNGQTFTADALGNAIVAVELGAGEEVVFDGLPFNATYQISEEAGAYTASYSIVDENDLGLINQSADENTQEDVALTTALEKLDSGEDVTVEFSNHIVKYQNIKIQKEVIGKPEDKQKDYEITVELFNLKPNSSIESDAGRFVADEDGYAIKTILLKDGEEFVIPEIPVGTQYQITEEKNSCYSSYTISSEDNIGQIVKAENSNSVSDKKLSTELETVNENEEATVLFRNISEVALTLEKIVDGNMGNKTDEFEFTVKVWGDEQAHVPDYRAVFIVETSSPSSPGYEMARIRCLSETTVYFNGEQGTSSDSWSFMYSQTPSFDYIPRAWKPFFLDYSNNIVVQQDDGNNEGTLYKTDLTITLNETTYSLFAKPGEYEEYNNIPNYNYTFYYDVNETENETSYVDLTNYGAVSIGNGAYKFTLSHGDKTPEIKVPFEYSYEILENDYSPIGYRTYVGNSMIQSRQTSGKLDSDKNVVFRNINGAAVPTEIRFWWWTGIPICLIPLLIFIKKRKVAN